MMTVEFWQNAERFYEFWFVNLGALIAILLMAFIFSFTYTQKKNRKKSFSLIFGVIAALALIGGVGYIKYDAYPDQAMLINPLIRDRIPTYLGYKYFGATEEGYYETLNDLDSLREMVLYEEEPILEPLIYLGEGELSHYFERENGDVFRHSQDIFFDEEVETPQLVGSQFHLIDNSFKELGFKNPANTMFSKIVIPASEEGKSYQPEDEGAFLRISKVIDDWNF